MGNRTTTCRQRRKLYGRDRAEVGSIYGSRRCCCRGTVAIVGFDINIDPVPIVKSVFKNSVEDRVCFLHGADCVTLCP
jgi:hypothetical protein